MTSKLREFLLDVAHYALMPIWVPVALYVFWDMDDEDEQE